MSTGGAIYAPMFLASCVAIAFMGSPGCLVNRTGAEEFGDASADGMAGTGGDAAVGGAAGFFHDGGGGEASAGGGIGGNASGGLAGAAQGGAGQGGAGQGGAGQGGTGGTPGCSGDKKCVSVPAGWQRGYMVPSAASCSAGFKQDGDLVHPDDLNKNATCSCGCNKIPGWKVCANNDVWLFKSIHNGCSRDGQAYDNKLPMGCSKPPALVPDFAFYVHSNVSAAGSADIKATMNPGKPVWRKSFKLCQSPPAGSCGGGKCFAPVPATTPSCVWTNGDKACPAAWNQEKYLLFTKLSETRKCSNCECHVNSGQVCNMRATTWTGNGCGGSKLDDYNLSLNQCAYLQHVYKIASIRLGGYGNYTGYQTSPSKLSGDLNVDTSSTISVCCTGSVVGL